jgi:hypothetical protein
MGAKHNKEITYKVQTGLPEGKEWTVGHLTDIKSFIKKESKKQTPEQQLNVRLLSIKYTMEETLKIKRSNLVKYILLKIFLVITSRH